MRMVPVVILSMACVVIGEHSLCAEDPVSDGQTALASLREAVVVVDVQTILIDDVSVPALVSGKVQRMLVKAGQRVTKGEHIVQLDAGLVEKELDLAEHEIGIAQLELEDQSRIQLQKQRESLTKQRLDRLRALRERNSASISLDQLQEADLDHKMAMADLASAQYGEKAAVLRKSVEQARYSITNVRLARHSIVSPFDGVVVDILKSEGEWVSEGEPTVRIVGLEKLRIEAFLEAAGYGQELVGKSATFLTPVPSQENVLTTKGSVVFVSPIVHPINGQIRVWVDVSNDTGLLRPGTRGTLHLWPQPNASHAIDSEISSPTSQVESSPSPSDAPRLGC